MTVDPLWKQIEAGLRERLDPELFERCAVDLLGDTHAGLVPVRGGADGGFDGAIASPDGAYTLIVTTAQSVIANVRKNLTTYLAERNAPARAVVATSQFLTPTKRINIEKMARKLGVTIVQIHDGEDFTRRLYRDARWRKQLLGISGEPPVLSRYALSGRSPQPGGCTGRGPELERVRSHTTDLLIFGQPGTGKTYLHEVLAASGECLFLRSEDATAIANAVRSQSPSRIVVDDAHTKLKLLRELVALRSDIGASFRIHANCWEGHESKCRDVLQLADAELIRLPRLRMSDIRSIIEESGILGPDGLLHMLITMADGKPGLAAGLCKACKKGDIKRVWSGELLADHLLESREIATTPKSRAVLAAFGLGGTAGMSQTQVARALGLSPLEVQDIVTRLATGGVIEWCEEDRLAVFPFALRDLLVARVFFSNSSSPTASELLEDVVDPAETASVLMGAQSRGGRVPLELIVTFLERCVGEHLWEHFASLSEKSAELVLTNFPKRVVAAADGLLRTAPRQAVPALLMNDDSSEHARMHDRTAVDAISRWIIGDDPNDDAHMDRRILVLECLLANVSQLAVHCPEQVGECLSAVLNPVFRRISQVPGKARTFSTQSGLYPRAQLHRIVELWQPVFVLLKRLPKSGWQRALRRVESWCLPQQLDHRNMLQAEDQALLATAGNTALQQIAEQAAASVAVKSWVCALARRCGVELGISSDPDYDLLMDVHSGTSTDFAAARTAAEAQLSSMAARFAAMVPEQAFRVLAGYADEYSELALDKSSYRQWWFYRELAGLVINPLWWADQMIAHGTDSGFVGLMLQAAMPESQHGVRERLKELIHSSSYTDLAIDFTLRLDPSDERLLAQAMAALPDSTILDSWTLSQFDLPKTTRIALLTHEASLVRGVFAIAAWERSKRDDRTPDEPEWRSAILDAPLDKWYELSGVFQKHPDIAYEWAKRIISLSDSLIKYGNMFYKAAAVLEVDIRRQLLEQLADHRYVPMEILDALIADDDDLMRCWACLVRDEYLQLIPLHRQPDARWIQRAITVLDIGVSPEAVAEVSFARTESWHGSQADAGRKLCEPYEALLLHSDHRLHATGRHHIKRLQRDIADAEWQERSESVFGMGSRRLAR